MLLQVSQLESQLPSQSWSQPSSQSPSQSESHEPSQLPPKTEQLESQLPSHSELQLSSQTQLESHDPSQLPLLVHVPESLRAKGGHASHGNMQERTRGWRADRPAAGATRSFQLPPSAVDSARDCRFVRREGRGLVVRWDHPAMDC